MHKNKNLKINIMKPMYIKQVASHDFTIVLNTHVHFALFMLS